VRGGFRGNSAFRRKIACAKCRCGACEHLHAVFNVGQKANPQLIKRSLNLCVELIPLIPIRLIHKHR
jgi:xanthine dehydrogenase iron-sulfur cluster and FAD-binding subunit A